MTEAQTNELLILLRQIAADVARISAQGDSAAKSLQTLNKVTALMCEAELSVST
jgi:hypothetical protein